MQSSKPEVHLQKKQLYTSLWQASLKRSEAIGLFIFHNDVMKNQRNCETARTGQVQINEFFIFNHWSASIIATRCSFL